MITALLHFLIFLSSASLALTYNYFILVISILLHIEYMVREIRDADVNTTLN